MTTLLNRKTVAAALSIAVAVACGGSGGEERASTPAEAPATTSSSGFDACAVVTQADATALFGQPAARQEGMKIPLPMLIGECLWTWDTETANQLLQFRVWSTEQAYSRPSDEYTQDYQIGDRGHVRTHPQGGVDVEWVQGGRMIGLSYSKVGSAVPSPTTKTEALKALAQKVASHL